MSFGILSQSQDMEKKPKLCYLDIKEIYSDIAKVVGTRFDI